MKLMISYGADPTIKDNNGNSAEDYIPELKKKKMTMGKRRLSKKKSKSKRKGKSNKKSKRKSSKKKVLHK
jgi:hypothetical protein